MSDSTVRSNCNITKKINVGIFKLPFAIIMDQTNCGMKLLTQIFVRATERDLMTRGFNTAVLGQFCAKAITLVPLYP